MGLMTIEPVATGAFIGDGQGRNRAFWIATCSLT